MDLLVSATPRTHNSDGTRVRGSSNGNERGSAEQRRARKAYLLTTYAADVALVKVTFEDGVVDYSRDPLSYWQEMSLFDVDQAWLNVESAEEVPTARCYRCGDLLQMGTITVDRIKPRIHGGTYARHNIRPACGCCNSSTGGSLRRKA
jgi:hypothetical protein